MKCRFLFAYPLGISEPPSEIKRPIAPLLAAGIIAGGAALANGIISGSSASSASSKSLQATRETNEANRQMIADTNQANLDLYREQFSDSMKAWAAENAYNSPSAQASRLRSAGLNPALSFGGQNTAGSVNIPSASAMQSSHDEQAPYEAYTDTFVRGINEGINSFTQSLQGLASFQSLNIDNQTKDAYNSAAISKMKAEALNQIQSSKTSKEQRRYLSSQVEALNLATDLNRATYDDSVKLSKLGVKYQNVLNRSLENQISVENQKLANDTARLSIEQYEAATHRKLSFAQIEQIKVMSNLAVNQDWRDTQSHVSRMNAAQLDYILKNMQIDDYGKQMIFNNVVRNSEAFHTQLKDKSAINRVAEDWFGLGFRDLGNLFKVIK